MLLRLADGRLLEYAVFGSLSRGAPAVVYHHGWPSCRHEAAFLHPHALHHGLRVLAVNRPGVGCSSYDPGYSFRSVVGAVRQLLDAEGLQRVAFMGTSGGGPYAAACAALLPERTSALCLVASMTHTRNAPNLLKGMAASNRLGYLAINHAPWAVGSLMAGGTLLMRAVGLAGSGRTQDQLAGDVAAPESPSTRGLEPAGPEAHSTQAASQQAPGSLTGKGGDSAVESAAAATTAPPALAAAADSGGGGVRRRAAGLGLSAAVTGAMLTMAGFSKSDRAAVARATAEQPELARLMAASGREAMAQGLTGLWQDMRLTSEPWTEFKLGSIAAPTLIWQGDQDLNVTVPMAQYFAASIHGAQRPPGFLRVVQGAGHISLGLDHGAEVVGRLAEVVKGQQGGGVVGAEGG